MIGDPEPDMTDPAVLIKECETWAAAMRQQAESARHGSAMAGAPFPHYTFDRTAALLDAVSRHLTAKAASATDAPPAPPPPSADPPKSKERR